MKVGLEWVRQFVEYVRYELQPGESHVGDQFPRQADADKALAILDEEIKNKLDRKRG